MEHFPIIEIRDETPACKNQLFFNSAGSSLISEKTKQIMISYLQEESVLGGYDLMMENYNKFDQFYVQAAQLIHAKPENISFQGSATDAYSKVIYSIDWKKGDRVLVSQEEYVSNLLSLYRLRDQVGVKIDFIKTDEFGDIDYEYLESELQKTTYRLLAVTHIPTSSGLIQDAERIGALAKKHHVRYLLDACQSIGQIEVDVNKIQCDYLSVTGRKFLRGPRGTGFLYVADHIIKNEESPICFDLNGAIWEARETYRFTSDSKRFEYWEKSYVNLLGLTQSIRELNHIGMKSIAAYNEELSQYFRKSIESIPGVKLFDQGRRKGNIITWMASGMTQEQHMDALEKIGVRFSFAMKKSAFIDFERKELDWAVRFSPHYFNLRSECDQFVDAFSKFI